MRSFGNSFLLGGFTLLFLCVFFSQFSFAASDLPFAQNMLVQNSSETESQNATNGELSEDDNSPQDEKEDFSQVDWDAEEEEDLSQVNWDAAEDDGDLSEVNWDEGEESEEEVFIVDDSYERKVVATHTKGIAVLFFYILGMFLTVAASAKIRLYTIIPGEFLIPLHIFWMLELPIIAYVYLKMRKQQ